MSKPLPETYPQEFDNYIKLVPGEDLLSSFHEQQALVDDYFKLITEEDSSYSYAEGKWSLKEMLQHMIDSERIFAYRALCIARKELQSLPGYEENEYASASNADARRWSDLCAEFAAVRGTTVMLFKSFTDDMLDQSGISNERPATTNAFGFTILGHVYHHKNVIEERYLPNIKS